MFEAFPRRRRVGQVGLGELLLLLAGAAEDAAEAALTLSEQFAPAHGHDGEREDAPRRAVRERVQGAEGQANLILSKEEGRKKSCIFCKFKYIVNANL